MTPKRLTKFNITPHLRNSLPPSRPVQHIVKDTMMTMTVTPTFGSCCKWLLCLGTLLMNLVGVNALGVGHNGSWCWNRGRTRWAVGPRMALEDLNTDTKQRYDDRDDEIKVRLLDLIAETPSNMPTSKYLTQEILGVARQLEATCPTPEDQVLETLAGNWELLWTAQDQRSDEWGLGPLRTWINPLENQSYSNNPSVNQGRASPLLPRPIQDRLENVGLITRDSDPVKSSQSIDLKKQQVRNVVSFALPSIGQPRKASLTVSVDFKPNPVDKRKIDVKFQACKLVVNRSPISINVPLGAFGPTGWLRTGYIDDSLRITRGHKGSIFILTRPGRS